MSHSGVPRPARDPRESPQVPSFVHGAWVSQHSPRSPIIFCMHPHRVESRLGLLAGGPRGRQVAWQGCATSASHARPSLKLVGSGARLWGSGGEAGDGSLHPPRERVLGSRTRCLQRTERPGWLRVPVCVCGGGSFCNHQGGLRVPGCRSWPGLHPMTLARAAPHDPRGHTATRTVESRHAPWRDTPLPQSRHRVPRGRKGLVKLDPSRGRRPGDSPGVQGMGWGGGRFQVPPPLSPIPNAPIVQGTSCAGNPARAPNPTTAAGK